MSRDVSVGIPGIYRRGDKYLVRVYTGTENGTAKTVSKIATSLAEAICIQEELKKKYSPSKQLTLGLLLQKWLNDNQSNLHYSTWLGYQYVVRKVMVSEIGNLPVEQIDHHTLNNFYASLLKQNMTPGRVWNYHRVIRAAIRWAVDVKQLLAKSPVDFKKVALPNLVVTKPHRYLHLHTIPRFIEICRQEKRGLIFLTLLFTGARLSEVLAWKWNDLDLEEGVVYVYESLQKGGENAIFSRVKTKNSVRITVLPSILLPMYKEHYETIAKEHKEWIEQNRTIFCNQDGNPLHKDNLCHRDWRRIRERLGLDVTVHGLRHTFITIASELGADDVVIQNQVGHANGHISARYKHPRVIAQKAWVEEIARMMVKNEKANGIANRPKNRVTKGSTFTGERDQVKVVKESVKESVGNARQSKLRKQRNGDFSGRAGDS